MKPTLTTCQRLAVRATCMFTPINHSSVGGTDKNTRTHIVCAQHQLVVKSEHQKVSVGQEVIPTSEPVAKQTASGGVKGHLSRSGH